MKFKNKTYLCGTLFFIGNISFLLDFSSITDLEFLFNEIMNFSGHLWRLGKRFFHLGPILWVLINVHKHLRPGLLSTHLEIGLLEALWETLSDLGKAINLMVKGRFWSQSLVDVAHIGLKEQAVAMLVEDMVAFLQDLALLGSPKSYLLA